MCNKSGLAWWYFLICVATVLLFATAIVSLWMAHQMKQRRDTISKTIQTLTAIVTGSWCLTYVTCITIICIIITQWCRVMDKSDQLSDHTRSRETKYWSVLASASVLSGYWALFFLVCYQ